MKEIPLTKGYVALVDDEYYDLLVAHKWTATLSKRVYGPPAVYAIRRVKIGGKSVGIYMHRVVFGGTEDVDHHDTNGINNQRHNLRPATESQNRANRKKFKVGSSSIWKGVSWNKALRKWEANVRFHGKKRRVGLFRDEVDAATAYNFAALETFGEFSNLNSAHNGKDA